MQNLQICNSCMVLRRKFSRCIDGISALISVSEATLKTRWNGDRIVRERDSTLTHARDDSGKRTVWREEYVLDIVHDNPQPALVTFPLQKDFARVRYGVVVPLPCVHRLQPGNLRLRYSRFVSQTIVDTPQFLCRVMHWRGSIYKMYTTYMHGQHRILMLFVTRHFRKY
jgi:hypothetical protein